MKKINKGSSKHLNHPPLNSTTTLNMLPCKIFGNSVFSQEQFVIPLVIYAAINAPSTCLSPLKSLKLMIEADNYLFIQYISNSLNSILALKGES